MKKIYKILIIFFCTYLLLILDVSAKPSLNMKVNNFQCQKSFINNSFESCDLELLVTVNDSAFSNPEYKYFNDLTYFIKCDANIFYTTISRNNNFLWNRKTLATGIASVKGLNNFSYLNIYTGRLNIVDDVIRVIPEDITCSIVRTF